MRLAAVHALKLLDTPAEERFDRISRLAAKLLGVPVAYVALLEDSRQWYKSSCGLGGMTETSRDWSLCSYTILSHDLLLCEDALEEPRFADNPYVTGPPNVRFYMGFPLATAEGHNIGTFCVMDFQPRRISPEAEAQFRDLAAMAEAEINLMDILTMQQELRRAYDFMRDVFGRYLTEQVASEILKAPDQLRLGGEKRRVTVLMSDLRGFTGLSERLHPEQVVDLLNRYLGRMVEVITRHDGTIDEFIGDAILVIFGAPLEQPDHARRAVACAVEMQLAMEAFNEENQRLGLPPQCMGVGINTGDVIVGNIGSNRRMKYGVVGSPVNLAARIESFTVAGQVLISESTLLAVGPILRVDGHLRVKVKGYDDPISIYEVGGIGADYGLYLPETRHLSPEAFQSF